MNYYILDDQYNPIKATVQAWSQWFETENRKVFITKFNDGATLSTVFIGVNYDLYETAIINPVDHIEVLRKHSTKEEAWHFHNTSRNNYVSLHSNVEIVFTKFENENRETKETKQPIDNKDYLLID